MGKSTPILAITERRACNHNRQRAYYTIETARQTVGSLVMNTQKRLYRSTQDRMFAGVCGGIGEYLDVDPTLVRLAFVALTLLSSGSGLVIYLILMLIVPERPVDRRKPKTKLPEDSDFPEDDASL